MSVNLRRTGMCLAVFLLAASLLKGMGWTDLAPRLRRSSSMVTDTLNHRVILFGGTNQSLSSEWFNDVWEMPLDGARAYAWHQLSPSGTPPGGRAMAAVAYDPVLQRMLVFGGQNPTAQYGDIWSLSLTAGAESWQQLSPSGTTPPVRLGAFAAYDPARNAFVIFGGLGAEWYNDLWLLNLDSVVWHHLTPSGNVPGQRFDAASFYHAPTGRMCIFGGRGIGVTYNDLWALDLTPGGEHWTQLTVGGSVPSGRYEFAYGYDQLGERLFIFAGWDPDEGGFMDEAYVLSRPGPVWTHLEPSGVIPLARRNSTGAYDPCGHRFIVFGGDLGGDYYLGGTCYLDVGDALAVSSWRTNLPVTAPTLNVLAVSTGTVRIDYTMALGERIELDVLNVSGQTVKVLLSGTAKSSGGSLLWDWRDNRGRELGQGLYFCRLQSGMSQVTDKLVMLGR
jgi:hypothetical protein